GRMWAKAVLYLRKAGAKAFAQYANREAATQFERALVAASHLPRTVDQYAMEIDLRFALRNALTPIGEIIRTLEHLEEARKAAEGINDTRRLGWAHAFAANALYQMGKQRGAIESGEAAIRLGEKACDNAITTAAQMYAGRAWLLLGEYARAIEIFRSIRTFL